MSGIMIQPTQGFFKQPATVDGGAVNIFIPIPAGFDSIEVFNQTKAAAAGGGAGIQFFFDPYSMTNGRGFVAVKEATIGATVWGEIAAGAGFFVTDTSDQSTGAAVAFTAITGGAVPPVVTTSSTAGLNDGDVVRLYNPTGAHQLGGMDFTVDVLSGTTFSLEYMSAIVVATNGIWRKIPNNPIYYPRVRYITKISKATQAIVTLSVTHGYHVGQKVRFLIEAVTATEFGMTELNNVVATIVAIGQPDVDAVTNTITIDVDTTNFTTFAFPLDATPRFTPAQIIPAGMDTAQALLQGVNIHSDASTNTAQIGVLLMAGAQSPGGQDDDVIEWRAFQSFDVNGQ